MQKLSILGMLAGTTLLCASPVSLQLSPQGKLSVSLGTANAEIGRPWTATSVAGVNRRVARRTARRAYYAENYGYQSGLGAGYPYNAASGYYAAGIGVGAAGTGYYGDRTGYVGTGYRYGVVPIGTVTAYPWRNGSYVEGGYWPGRFGALDGNANAGYTNAAYTSGGAGGDARYYNGNAYRTRVYVTRRIPSGSYYGPVCDPWNDRSCR